MHPGPPPPPRDVDTLRTRLRADLTAAMKARRPEAVSALRSALAAIDNAEAVEAAAAPIEESSPHVAGAREGLGAAEARRRVLSLDEVLALLRAEVDERLAEADRYDARDQAAAAGRLRDEAGVIAAYLAP
ncbi:MAG: hypothetical protein AB7I08_03370 [Thermoleophilia bacterium]